MNNPPTRGRLLLCLLTVLELVTVGQTDTNTVLRFTFNDQALREENNRIPIKPVGVSLTYDRFGNKKKPRYHTAA